MTRFDNSWNMGNVISTLALLGVIGGTFNSLGKTDENLSVRLATQEIKSSAQDARLSALEQLVNNQAVTAATTAAQLAALRESLSELKSSQAEANRLLRSILQGEARAPE